MSLDELISLKRSIKLTQDALEVSAKRYGEEIMSRMCADGEIVHVTPEGWKAELYTGKSEDRISELRLVEHGVSADVIAESREKGKSYEYVKITKVKEKSK